MHNNVLGTIKDPSDRRQTKTILELLRTGNCLLADSNGPRKDAIIIYTGIYYFQIADLLYALHVRYRYVDSLAS
jgi:hypothetical protein